MKEYKNPVVAHFVGFLLFGLIVLSLIFSLEDLKGRAKQQVQVIESLQQENEALTHALKECQSKPKAATLRLSAYSLDPKQCDSDPKNTATMSKPGWTLDDYHNGLTDVEWAPVP